MNAEFDPTIVNYKEDRGDAWYFRDEQGNAIVTAKHSVLAEQLLERVAVIEAAAHEARVAEDVADLPAEEAAEQTAAALGTEIAPEPKPVEDEKPTEDANTTAPDQSGESVPAAPESAPEAPAAGENTPDEGNTVSAPETAPEGNVAPEGAPAAGGEVAAPEGSATPSETPAA